MSGEPHGARFGVGHAVLAVGHPLHLAAATQVLEAVGFEVIRVDGPAQARQRKAERRWAILVFEDSKLEEKDALELRSGIEAPLIFLTRLLDPQQMLARQEAVEAEAIGSLPCSTDQFIKLLGDVVRPRS